MQHIADGKGQDVTQLLETAPPGPIETKWGLGFREYDECVAYIEEKGLSAPDGGVVLPLRSETRVVWKKCSVPLR